MKPAFRVSGKVNRPVSEVFEAVRDPDKLTRYFCDRASGPLDAGTEVSWEFDMHKGTFESPVVVKEVVENERIVFEWPAATEANTEVIMKFSSLDGGATLLEIFESGWPDDEEGVRQSYENCSGWTHMLCSLVAWIDSGSEIRDMFRFPED